MNPLQSIETWLARQGWGQIDQCQPVYGGSICDCFHVITHCKKDLFIKTRHKPPANFFKVEAVGLRAIAETNTIKTPRIFHHEQDCLVLEYLKPGEKTEGYWEDFGRRLAAMHQTRALGFGFCMDNFCGLTPQPNPVHKDGYAFFAEHRLLYQTRMAFDHQRLTANIVSDIELLCKKLPDLVPKQPATLIHGDLWHGNAYCSIDSEPVLIDPACSWGWAEGELAMTHLFGGFPDCFYQAYFQQNPQLPDFDQRIPLYNLYHLLNHLNLFGKSYLSEVTEIINCYN